MDWSDVLVMWAFFFGSVSISHKPSHQMNQYLRHMLLRVNVFSHNKDKQKKKERGKLATEIGIR